MIVQYYISSENLKEPSAFSVRPSEQELTVGDIKSNFPLSGNYYLRFKTVLQEESPPMTVWLDGLDDFAPVPTYKDQIIIKALRLCDSRNPVKLPRKVYKDSKTVLNKPPSSGRKISDLLIIDDFSKHQERSHSALPGQNFENKIFEKPEITKKTVDPTGGLNTEQLKKRAEDRIKEHVAQKTEDVKKIWQDEANLRQEKQSADRELGEKINNWETRNHQKNNIRTLLATMHNVLWPNSGWEQISPADLVTSGQVKTAYFKSLNIIHPDKHQQDPPNIRYIAERVFGAVNEAFKSFRSTNNPS